MTPEAGEVWVRQSDGCAVLVTETVDPMPAYDPAPAMGWGARNLSEQDLKLIRAGAVHIAPVAACHNPQCPHANPDAHRDCPPGFHLVAGRRSTVRLDRWANAFALLRRAT